MKLTDEEILRMAKGTGAIEPYPVTNKQIIKLARLIQQHENEQCAKVCESQVETGAHLRCAAAIRARMK